MSYAIFKSPRFLTLSFFFLVLANLVNAMPNLSNLLFTNYCPVSRDDVVDEQCSMAWSGPPENLDKAHCTTPPDWSRNETVDVVLGNCINTPVNFMSVTMAPNCFNTVATSITIWNRSGCP